MDCLHSIYHVQSSSEIRSTASAGLLAGGTSGNRGRQSCFFRAHAIDETRFVPDKINWKISLDAVYWFDLKIAQILGPVFWQMISNAIIFDDTMPAECL